MTDSFLDKGQTRGPDGEHVLTGGAAVHDHTHPHEAGEHEQLHHGSHDPEAHEEQEVHDHHVHAYRGHHHHGHGHALQPGQRPSLGSLVTIGISGGMVPCPAALPLLLAAAGVGNVLDGVSLVVVFSLGLAAVLIAIGIALVKAAGIAGRHLGPRLDADGRLSRYAGAASAVVVTALGLFLTARAAFDVSGWRLLGWRPANLGCPPRG